MLYKILLITLMRFRTLLKQMLPKVKAPVAKIKIEKCVKIEKSGCPGRGVVLEIRTHPDKGRGGGLKIRDFGGRPL